MSETDETDVSSAEHKEQTPSDSHSEKESVIVLEAASDEEEEEEPNGTFFVSEFPPFRDDAVFEEADERRYENTYLVEPKVKINRKELKEITQRVLETNLDGKQYEYNEMRALSADISLLIRNEIKELGYDRYKIVVCVVIGEKMGHGVAVVNRNLWDTNNDYIAFGRYQNNSIFATAVVGVFYKT